jgi:hypothetical protein
MRGSIMKSIDKNDALVRKAIYNVYGGKSFYGYPLDFLDMQLDHIIPESMKNNNGRLKELLMQCGLGEDFELNSLYNLVPTSRFENRRKSDLEFSPTNISYFIEITSSMVTKIEKEIIRLKKKSNFDRDISNVKAYVDEVIVDLEKEKVIEKLVNFINNEDEFFIESEQVYEFENREIYKKYTKRIAIEATLPRYNNCEIDCILYFKTLKARDCKIILDNETIIRELFGGLFVDPKYGTRGFIEFDEYSKDNLKLEELENVVVKLGNNRLKLKIDDIYLLCEVIDAFAKTYLSKIRQIEGTLETARFPLSKRRNSYKFISCTPEQWYKLAKFANKHDVDNGRSQWHIFDKNPTLSQIKVFTNKSHSKYKLGYHSFFTVEKDEDCVFHPFLASNKLVITWQFMEDLYKQGVEFINEYENWNADQAYSWLVNEFASKARVKLDKKLLHQEENNLKEIFENNKIKFIKYIRSTKVKTVTELIGVVSMLQEHFHYRPRSKYLLSKQELEGIYSVLIICTNLSKTVDKYYLTEKLSLEKCSTKGEILRELENSLKNTDDKIVSGFNLDNIFRALFSVLEDSTINLDSSKILDISKKLDRFIDIHDTETLLDKYAVRYITW